MDVIKVIQQPVACKYFGKPEGIYEFKLLRGNFYLCRVFSTKSVQNLNFFWRTIKIRFVLALFYSLLTELHFEMHLTAEKHKALTKFCLVKVPLSLVFEITAILAVIKEKTKFHKNTTT